MQDNSYRMVQKADQSLCICSRTIEDHSSRHQAASGTDQRAPEQADPVCAVHRQGGCRVSSSLARRPNTVFAGKRGNGKEEEKTELCDACGLAGTSPIEGLVKRPCPVPCPAKWTYGWPGVPDSSTSRPGLSRWLWLVVDG
jgi:hypothetical protein